MAPAALLSIVPPRPSASDNAIASGAGDTSPRDLVAGIIETSAGVAEIEAFHQELRQLAHDRHPEIFAESLLSLVGRQIRAGRHEAAAAGFSALQQMAEHSALPPALRQRIGQRVAAYQGQGSVGDRVEHHFQNFTREAMHPATLAGFALGAGAFQSARLFALSRLSLAPAGIFTRSVGARLIGGSAGLAAEVPALTFGSRGLRSLMGERVEWTGAAIGHELSGTAITLGLMRGAGFGARRGFEAMHGLPVSGQSLRWAAAAPLSGPVFQQTAMLGSLMMAHDIEGRLGLRPQGDLAANFTDSLMTLLQFQVGGRIFHELQPRAFAQAVQTAETRSQNLSGPRLSFPSLGSLLPISSLPKPAFASPAQVPGLLTMAELPKRPPEAGTTEPPRPRSTLVSTPFRFRRVVEALQDPIIVTDPMGRLIYLNEAGRKLSEGTPLGWLQGTLDQHFRRVENEEGIFTFTNATGDVSYWRMRSNWIEEGEPYRMNHFSDVTQVRLLQEIAARSEMKADLAEGLVHDAGNMIAAAYQQERNIERDLGEGPPISERASFPPGTPMRFQRTGPSNDSETVSTFRSKLASLAGGVRELGTMLDTAVQAFRDNQRVLGGARQVRILQLQPLLEKALRLNESMRQRAGVELKVEFGEEPPLMMGEEGPLLSAVLNLFINACHAMPRGGELRVRTFAENGVVTIEVQDTGTGIAAENLPHIFEPHFTTKEHSGGTGMGLANVNLAIVRVHGGHIEVASEVGKGTTFRLLLPQTRPRSH